MRVQCIDLPQDSAPAAGLPTMANEQSISLRCLPMVCVSLFRVRSFAFFRGRTSSASVSCPLFLSLKRPRGPRSTNENCVDHGTVEYPPYSTQAHKCHTSLVECF